MCTFHDEAAVTVCDVAIGRIRCDLREAFPGAIITHLEEGQGTLVQAGPAGIPVEFGHVVRASR